MWLIFGIYLFTVVGGLVLGLFILISPSKFRELGDRLGRADRFSTRNPDWKPGLELQWRLMGAAVAGGAILMLAPVIRAALFHHKAIKPVVTANPPQQPGPDWYSLGMSIVIVLVGAYTHLWPEKVARWAATTMPHRKFSNETVQRGLWPIRIGGAVMGLAGIWALLAWLKSHA
jgi:hypothetical protein